MQGSFVDHTVLYLGICRVKSLNGFLIEEIDCTKLTDKRPCNNDALNKININKHLQRKPKTKK